MRPRGKLPPTSESLSGNIHRTCAGHPPSSWRRTPPLESRRASVNCVPMLFRCFFVPMQIVFRCSEVSDVAPMLFQVCSNVVPTVFQ